MTSLEISFNDLSPRELNEIYRVAIKEPRRMDIYLLANIKNKRPKELMKRLAEGQFPMNSYLNSLCMKIKNRDFISYNTLKKDFLLNYDELSSLLPYLEPLKLN